MNYDIVIRTILQGQGLQATEAQIAALAAQLRALNEEASNSTFGDVFGGAALGTFIGDLAGDVISAGIGKIRELTFSAIGLADKIEDLAAKAGVGGRALQIIGNAASTGTGSIEGVAEAFAFLNRSSAAARSGNEEVVATFERLNVSLDDLRSQSPEQVMMQIADATANTTDRAQAYDDVLTVLGRSSGNLYSTLETGSKAIDELGRSMGVFTDVSRVQLAVVKDELEKLNNQSVVLAGNLAGVAGVVAQDASGPISKVWEALARVNEESGKVPESLQNIAKATAPILAAVFQAGAKVGNYGADAAERAQKAYEEAAKVRAAKAKADAEIQAQDARAREAMVDVQAEIARGLKTEAEQKAELLATGRALNENMEEQGRIAEILMKLEDQRGRALDDNMESLGKQFQHMEKQKPSAEKLAQDAEREAAARERAAIAAERARNALEDLEGDFEGVDQPGEAGVAARAKAREKFTREQQRRADDAVREQVPPAEIARITAEKEAEFNADMRRARGRFGGGATQSERNTTGGSGPSADFQKAFGGSAPVAPDAAGGGGGAAQQVTTAARNAAQAGTAQVQALTQFTTAMAVKDAAVLAKIQTALNEQKAQAARIAALEGRSGQ